VGSFDPSKIAVELDPVAEIAGSPLSIAAPDDGSGRLFVADKGGPIWIVVDGKVGEQPLLDISSKVSTGGEQGLLGLALYPDFPADPRLVIDYTDVDDDTVVSE